MAICQLNLAENSLKPNKFQAFPQKSNGISFWAFLLSIFIFISIFYIFNLSPLSLLNTTKFWFFISNTLIVIIAADFGAFSSRKEAAADFYEDYAKNSQANSIPSFESQYWEVVKTSIPPQKEENSQESQEKIKEVYVAVVHKSKSPENDLKLFVKDDSNKSNEKLHEKMPELTMKANNHGAHGEKKNEARCVPSVSSKAFPVTNIENKIILRWTESEKHEPVEEENEFSKMSNEELNRRVEEFIRRFNRQIRLQAPQNRIRQI